MLSSLISLEINAYPNSVANIGVRNVRELSLVKLPAKSQIHSCQNTELSERRVNRNNASRRVIS